MTPPADLFGVLVRPLLEPDDVATAEPLVLSDDEAMSLRTRCQMNRITPLLANALSLGLIEVGEEQAEGIRDELTQVMTTVVAIEDVGLRAYDVLDSGGVDVRVTKGLATAHLDYSNPALRQFGDADLLVRPTHFDKALQLLAEADILQKFPLRGGRWEVQHSVPLNAGGLEIDLHHRLLHQAAGHLIARTDLFADPEEFEVGGRAIKALPAPLRLIQAAGQNVLSAGIDTKFSSDVDVMVLRRNADAAYALADDVHLGWMLDLGFGRAGAAAGDSEAPHRSSSGGLVSRVLSETYSMPRPSTGRLAMTEALVAPIRMTLANGWSTLRPGPAYLEMRGRSRGEQLRRQAGRVLRRPD